MFASDSRITSGLFVLFRNHLRWHKMEEESRLKEKLEERGTEQEVVMRHNLCQYHDQRRAQDLEGGGVVLG